MRFLPPLSIRGFTLIETIMVIAVTSLISVTLGSLLVYFYKTNAYTLEQTMAVAQARRGVEDAMSHLREASYGSDGAYPIASVATTSITFYANMNADSTIERVTYTVQGSTLFRIIATPVGNPLSYTGATLATSTMTTPIVNNSATPVFTFFDASGTQLAAPVDITKIVSVQTTLVVDVNTSRAPVAFTLSGSATLRNLRSQL